MVGATLLAVVCVAAELVGAAPRDEFVERWLDPALRAPLVRNISLLAPRNNHRAGTGDVFVMPTLDAGAGFPRGSASRWCVGVVSRDGWQVPCHAPGPLDAGKGIWLHDMPPGAYELWVFLVEGTAADANAVGVRADGGSGPVGERAFSDHIMNRDAPTSKRLVYFSVLANVAHESVILASNSTKTCP